MVLTALLGRNSVMFMGLVGFAVVPLFLSPYYVFIANLALIHILLAIGLNIVLGYAGQFAFANAALFGVGAYVSGLLRFDYGVPFWLAVPIGIFATALIGLLVALPAMRLRGLYLALATLAFAQFTIWVFVHWDSVTHGTSGFVLQPLDFSPLPVSAAIGLYYVSLAITVVFVVLAASMLRSRVGRAFVAIRESEHAAEALAIGLVKYKAYAYVVSAIYAGLAGGLFTGAVGAVVPDQFGLFQVVLQFCMIFVGGVGSLWGSVLGAVLLIGAQEAMRDLKGVQEIGFGLLLLLVILFFPGGLVAVFKRHLSGWDEPLRGKPRCAS